MTSPTDHLITIPKDVIDLLATLDDYQLDAVLEVVQRRRERPA